MWIVRLALRRPFTVAALCLVVLLLGVLSPASMAVGIFSAAGTLDPRTRTMQVEIDIDNRSFGMLPGTFAHVALHLREPLSPEIPDEAILCSRRQTMVCVVEDDPMRKGRAKTA